MDDDSDFAYVVFPRPHGGDVKRMSRRLADAWYPYFPRATKAQWERQEHPSIMEETA